MKPMPTVKLRHLTADDEKVFLSHIRRSRDLHRAWVQVPTSAKAFQRYVQEMNTPDDQAYVVMCRGTQAMVGVVCLLYTSPSPRDRTRSRMPSSA